jgi:hypothetical protein
MIAVAMRMPKRRKAHSSLAIAAARMVQLGSIVRIANDRRGDGAREGGSRVSRAIVGHGSILHPLGIGYSFGFGGPDLLASPRGFEPRYSP